jgi:hypothetical protein
MLFVTNPMSAGFSLSTLAWNQQHRRTRWDYETIAALCWGWAEWSLSCLHYPAARLFNMRKEQ